MTMQRQSFRKFLTTAALGAIVLLAACSSDDGGGGNPAPTATTAPSTATATIPVPTATLPAATATPTTAVVGVVRGLIVLRDQVPVNSEDAVGTAPPEWMESPDAAGFDRALSYADWVLEGPSGRTGTTAGDGRFEITDLPSGRYTLFITKTLDGNLASLSVPLVVGSDGAAEVIIEVDRGLVRSSSTYRDGNIVVRETSAPDSSRMVSRGGEIVEIDASGRTLIDPDGDGSFENPNCVESVTACDPNGQCTTGRCQCTASCPFCDDCGPGVCAPAGVFSPYRCNDDNTCSIPGDRCVCVTSCDDCTDCVRQVCVPSCEPLEIDAITVVGPSQVRVGRQTSLRAVAQLSTGGSMDVTFLATWTSSDSSIASVDSWGLLTAHAVGQVSVSAALADITSTPASIEVVERPALRRIQVEIGPCIYPIGIPEVVDPTRPPEPSADFFPDPYCRHVVRIGSSISLIAFGEFEDNQFEDITHEVEWDVEPANVGEVGEGGLFTGTAAGTASVTAALGGVVSDAREIRVVSQPTLVQLTIYPINSGTPPIFFPVFEDDPRPNDAPFPCFECGFPVTLLRGDVVHFIATARYDTGEWEDVTTRVTWSSSAAEVATISDTGELTAVEAGNSTVTAELDEVSSNPVNVTVVNEATLQYLGIYQEGLDRVVEKGGQAFFRASANYDVGFARDVTEEVTWHSSNESIGGFEEPGIFIGRAAGDVEVWAELDGVESARLPMSVFETSDITYCDATDPNRGFWSDAFNRVVLESDCKQYEPPAIVTLRFTVTERERPFGIFDPCLDLFVYQDGRKIRTIRNEGCGEPFLAPGAPDFEDEAPRFQLKAFWDLKDDRGNLVAPGRYTIYGRFYLYFDPVVSIEIDVTAPGGRIPCTVDTCGNGCGYVHACGDDGLPAPCPEVCTEICSCPAGWGITPEGDCEPCGQECCPDGRFCIPELPPCAGAMCGGIAGLGCPDGQSCDLRDPMCATDVAGTCVPSVQACPEFYQPVCGCDGQTYANECFRIQAGATLAHAGACGQCCPPGALCGPLDLPPCVPGDCCPRDPAIVCPDVLPLCEP